MFCTFVPRLCDRGCECRMSGKGLVWTTTTTYTHVYFHFWTQGFWVSSSSLIFRQFYFTTYEIIRHRLGPGSKVYQRLGPDAGEVVRNLSAGAGSSVVFQVFTVPIDIISQVCSVCVDVYWHACEEWPPVGWLHAGREHSTWRKKKKSRKVTTFGVSRPISKGW